MSRKRDKLYSNPIAQAVMRQQVMEAIRRIKRDAELQAYAGARVSELVSQSCILLYAVAWACNVRRIPSDSPDIRIMRSLANVLEDLAHYPARIETHRPTIQSGMAAIERVLPGLEPLAIGVGMVACKNRIAQHGIGANDIHELLGSAQGKAQHA